MIAGLVGVPWPVVGLLAAIVGLWAVIGFASIAGDDDEDGAW